MKENRGDLAVKLHEHWKKRVREQIVTAMLQSRSAALRYLKHEDAAVRSVALSVLSDHWTSPPDDQLAEVCEHIFFHDPNHEVRHAALLGLGRCYYGTDDVSVGRFLAKVVRDESESEEIRAAAFMELHFVRGSPPRSIPGLGERPVRMPTLKDVDWTFVDSFFVEGRTPTPLGDPIEERIALAPEPLRSGLHAGYSGQKAYDRGDYNEAVMHFTKALHTNPELRGILICRGRAYRKLGKLDEAIADFTELIRLDPRRAETYRERSAAYRTLGWTFEADADEQQARALEDS